MLNAMKTNEGKRNKEKVIESMTIAKENRK